MSESPGFFSWLASQFFVSWTSGRITDHLAADLRDDPTYKKNVEDLIARNKAFEQERQEPKP